MNVLWVEDFGGGLRAESSTLVNMFRGLLAEQVFDDEWNPEADLIGNPQCLTDFFLQHSPTHRVTLLRHFGDFQRLPGVISLQFDAVALDINLSRGVPVDVTLPAGFRDEKAFHAKAGFYIYNQLLCSGFPAESICFLTGEKESTFGEFADHCQKALIPLPAAFGKDDAGLESFRSWLKERQNSPYIQLRRGVIEGCQLLRRLITERPDVIQFQLFLKNSKVTVKTMDDYLVTLESFLPPRPPEGAALTHLLRLFIRALAHEWETDANPQLITGRGKDRLHYVLRAYAWVMKAARNWLAHGENLDQPSVKLVAYLFLVNHRAMYALPAEAQNHERLLLTLFGSPGAAMTRNARQEALERTYSALVTTWRRTGHELMSPPYFNSLANDLETAGISGPHYRQLLLQILWHQLAQRPPRNNTASTAYECDCREQNFRLGDDPNDFLNELLRHIQTVSFDSSQALSL